MIICVHFDLPEPLPLILASIVIQSRTTTKSCVLWQVILNIHEAILIVHMRRRQ